MGNQDRKFSSAAALALSKPLGRSKASKFAEVEGLTLTKVSANEMAGRLLSSKKGDRLREAITESFKKRQKKK